MRNGTLLSTRKAIFLEISHDSSPLFAVFHELAFSSLLAVPLSVVTARTGPATAVHPSPVRCTPIPHLSVPC